MSIATGLGEARNLAIIRTVDVLIAIDGLHGALSEIGSALKMGKRVIGLRTWDVNGVVVAETSEMAVAMARHPLAVSCPDRTPADPPRGCP